jgi:hypothetical protein
MSFINCYVVYCKVNLSCYYERCSHKETSKDTYKFGQLQRHLKNEKYYFICLDVCSRTEQISYWKLIFLNILIFFFFEGLNILDVASIIEVMSSCKPQVASKLLKTQSGQYNALYICSNDACSRLKPCVTISPFFF